MSDHIYHAIQTIKAELVDVEIRINGETATACLGEMCCDLPMGCDETEQFIESLEWVSAQRLKCE